MTKTKSTKRALLLSVLSLLMCLSMLIGSTFAWFTDSVTSGRNIIQAGNLDVVLEYWDGDSYEEVASTTKLFDDAALWEPGYTEVAYLKVSNAGSLALKYHLAVNVYNETLGKTKTGADIKLSDHLQFKVVESDTDLADTYTRETAQNANATATKLQTYSSEDKVLEKKGDADYVALIVYMPTTVGNEANHDGVNVPSIEMGVSLLAAQLTSEFDSFDNMYDENADYIATVGSAAELANALKAGGKIILSSDIVLDEGVKLVVDEGVVANLNLNGKKLIGGFQTGSTTKHVYPIENRGTLTLTGDGEVSGRGVANYGNLTIESGTYKAIDTNGGACVWNYAGSLTINGGTFETADSATTGATGIHFAEGTQGTINGGKLVSNANQTLAINNLGTLTINYMEVLSDHIVIGNQGTLEINGGDFELVGVRGQTSNMFYMTSGITTINAGNFIFNKNNVLDSGHLLTFAGGKVVVNGGNFEGYVTTQLDNYGYASGKATVNGGTFDQDPSKYVAAGYQVFEDNGTYTVKSNASVLTEALAQGGTVTLDKDTVVAEPITIPAGVEVVLNLNGKTISGSTDGSLFVNNGKMSIVNGTLKNTAVNGGATINNKGTLELSDAEIIGAPIASDAGYPAYCITNAGNLTVNDGTNISADRGCLFLSGTGETVINGGTFTNNDISQTLSGRAFTSHVVVVGYGANNKLTINDGTFKHLHTSTSGGVVINNWSAVTVEVKGGNFSGGNYFGKWDNLSDYGYGSTKAPFAVTGGTFTGMDSKFVAEGYQTIDNGDGTLTVVAK